MTSVVSTTLVAQLKSTKQVSTGDTTATPPTINLDLGTPAANFTNSTTIDAQEVVSTHVVMSGGIGTIDLTNVQQLGISPNVNFTGMKLRAIQVFADAANTHPISIATGATYGYTQAGTIGPLNAGGHATHYLPGTTAVDATHKTLDVTGTGAEGLEVHLVFGVN
jgi:hypothetical protein